MAKTVRIPVLGQSVEEVRIVRWLRAVGDSVEAGTPIAEVETDKTNIEWESPESGTLLKILIAEGAYAAVEAPALVLGVPGSVMFMNLYQLLLDKEYPLRLTNLALVIWCCHSIKRMMIL